MGQGVGSNVITNGLVFSYDANSEKSYTGPPIQNMANTITASGSFTGASIGYTAGTEFVSVPTLGKMTVPYMEGYNSNSASYCCLQQFYFVTGNGYVPCSGSTQYTYGIVYRTTSGYTHANYMYRYEYNSSGTYVGEAGVHDDTKRVHLGDGWYWAWNTFTTQSTTARLYLRSFYYQYNVLDRHSVAKVLVTPGDYTGLHPRLWPALGTTKSSTATILDLTGQNTITIAGLTYAADGTFSFGGSDRLNFTLNGSASSTGYTRIVWIKPTQSNADMKSVMLNVIGNNSDMAVGIQNNKAAFHQYTKTGNSGTTDGDYTAYGSTTLSLNTIYMIAITVDRSSSTNNINIYVNGQLDGTASLALGASASDAVIIGGPATDSYSGVRMFYGSCYIAQHYNRVLNLAEIQQNFNALRGRYGI